MLQMYGLAMSTIGRDESPSFVPADHDAEPVYTVAEIGTRLLDHAHSSWLAAEIEASITLGGWLGTAGGTLGGWLGTAGGTLGGWLGTAGGSREDAYRAYVAAADREQAAADDLQRLWKMAALTQARDDRPANV
jgi:uncharacterized membrane protein